MRVTRGCGFIRGFATFDSRWPRQARGDLGHGGRRWAEGPVLSTVVVDEQLDLRGQRACDLPTVEVARAIAHAEGDHNPPSRHRLARSGPIRQLEEVVVDIGSTGRWKAGADDDTIERQPQPRPGLLSS